MYKVVLIDDEKSVKQTLRIILESGFPLFQIVGEASDGREGMEIIRRLNPDLVITDIRMPVMDGLQLAEQLSAQPDRPEIVFISGYDTFDYLKQAIRFGVNDYLLKPLSAVEVRDILGRIADKLQSERIVLQESLDWLHRIKDKVKQLAKQVWMINEDNVYNELAHIHEEFLSASFVRLQYKDMTAKLFFLLEIEISALSGSPVSFNKLSRVQFHHLPDAMFIALKSQLQMYMDEIRMMRKWSSYKPIMKAVAFIQDNYDNKDLTIADAARVADMSPSYFSKCFIDEMALSFTAFLIKLRLNKALELLNNTTMKVYEISQEVGYGNYDHFAKTFKKQFGISPSEYRNRITA